MSSSSSKVNDQTTYGVFPSFHGDDVRRSFIRHLRVEFESKAINAFDDTDMERGNSITPELRKAIEGSKIALVVLSKNYASSTWCLDELAKIMECRKDLNQTVMTAFYEVKPSHVQNRKKEFGEVFKKTCVENIEDNDGGRKRVQGWEKALKEVGEIAGETTYFWVDDDDGMIKKIAKDVSNKLLHSTRSHDFDGLVGMQAHMINMKPLLRLGLKEVRMIGVWGPPGIGKTTIANYLFNKHSKRFQMSTLMKDIRSCYVGPYLDVHGMKLKMQRDFLAKIINQDDLKITHLESVPNRLKNKKVLVVLDDVDRLDQLGAMAKTIEWFGPGSRIIITSEDRDVLEKHDAIKHIYQVDPPDETEALEIFCTKAFNQKLPKDGFKDLAIQAMKKSRGLPFGLQILGSHFKGMTQEIWKLELLRLDKCLNGTIKEIFMFSYKALCIEDRKLFLRIANYFEGERMERLQTYLGDSLKTGIEVLIKKSLISTYLGYIVMHDLLVQFGREVYRYDVEERVICGDFLDDAKEIVKVLRDETTGFRNIIGIDLDLSEITRGTKISKSAFTRIDDLQFLKVYDDHVDNNSGDILILPEDLECLSKELKLLHWEYFDMPSLPSNFNTKFLVKLHMPYSNLKKLWSEIHPLENLKWMDLHFSENLEELPDLSTATNLKRLDLRSCSSLEMLPDSIGNAITLSELNISGCSSLKKLPDSIGNAKNLHSLYLSRCSGLVKLPSSIWNAKKLTYLSLGHCSSLEEIPSPIKKLTKLLDLDLSHCSKLVKLPFIGKLVNLEKLDLGGCSGLVELPASLGNATNITELNLSECSSLKKLPLSIGKLVNLKKLDLGGCSGLVELPASLGNATNITELNLSECSSLKKLPLSIGKLHKLYKLRLKGCSSLEVLPSNINLESLYELDLTDCFFLRYFPEVSTNITVLKLIGTSIKEVPSSIESWPCVKSLEISYFDNLKVIPHGLGIIKVLQFSNTEIQEIPPWIKNLSYLRQLVLKGCKNLVSLPQLPDSLSNLVAENCESLERLYFSFPNPKIRLNFANFLKLNQEARNLIIETSTSDYAILPSKEVPLDFTCQDNGGSVTVELKQKPLPKSLRFKVCILLAKVPDHNLDDGKTMRISSYVKKPNALIDENIPCSHSLTLLLTDHLYVFEIETKVKTFKLEFAFKAHNDKWKIGKCGVKLLEVPRVHEIGESSKDVGMNLQTSESIKTLELK